MALSRNAGLVLVGWYLMVPPIVLIPAGSHDVSGKSISGFYLEWLDLSVEGALTHWETIGSYDTAADCRVALSSLDIERTAQLKIERAERSQAVELKNHRAELIVAL